MKKFLKYILFAIVAFIIIGIIAVNSNNAESKTVPYRIASLDSSKQQLTFQITINNRTDKDSLIEIARQLKEQRDWKEKVVCYFNIRVLSHSTAWASCAYLPECNGCNTDKDKDGNLLQFNLIGINKSLADSLQKLTLDSIENKKLEASFIDDTWKCKTELYSVNSDNSKILMAQLFNNNEKILQWVSVREVNGQKRLYFPEDDEHNYINLDSANKTANFYNGESKIWLSTAID